MNKLAGIGLIATYVIHTILLRYHLIRTKRSQIGITGQKMVTVRSLLPASDCCSMANSVLLSHWPSVRIRAGALLKALIHNRFEGYFNHSPTIHNIAIWTIWDSMGQIYGIKWALLFVETVPLLCQMPDRSWQKRDFFYYAFIMNFLCVSYPIL